MGRLPGGTLVIGRVLNRGEVIDVHVVGHDDDPGRVLPGRPLNPGGSLGKAVFLGAAELDVLVPLVGLYVTIGGLIRHGTNRPGPEHVLLTEEDFHVVMGNWLVVPGEVQVNIRDLVPLEPKEGLEWDVVPVLDQKGPTLWTVALR